MADIRIRTMKTDMESMKASGGEAPSGIDMDSGDGKINGESGMKKSLIIIFGILIISVIFGLLGYYIIFPLIF